MSGHTQARGGGVRKMVIVLLLVGGVMLLHRFAGRPDGLDPSAMLALGFVILASYAFGQLVEQVGLPHITGYLIAGLLLGPSIAALLPESWGVPPPFDEGVLSDSVQEQLQPLNTLAVALIALTAGGELKIENLRKGLGTIVGVLGGQIIVIMALSIAFVVGLSGVIPDVAIPGIGEVDLNAALWLGAILGSISIATSPAATIAVINDVEARGPMTSALLATVVLKDVVVVVLFSVVSTFAVQALGLEGGAEGGIGLFLLQHIGGALAIGTAVGFAMAVYLRYVKAEPLLFLVGIVFTAAFVAAKLDVEMVVLFIAAGFVAANFSSEGDHLLENVEKLSLPVYVVFFTLAGAHLPIDETFIGLLLFALGLVALRAFSIYLGTAVGGALFGASTKIKKYGWLGFVSQAGVAISLASIVGRRMGEPGAALSTLIIAGIAINEVIGPVLLKVGLGAAKETARHRGAAEEEEEASAPEATEDEPLKEWPAPDVGADAWGAPSQLSSSELNEVIHDLQLDLSHVARDVAEEPLRRFREGALEYVRELRREFLRHHRRITVQATGDSTELTAAEALRLEQSELAEKWRGAVLGRAGAVRQAPDWEPGPIVAAVDAITEGLPERVAAPYEDESFGPTRSDSVVRATARWWLRARRGGRRLFGESMAPRNVEVRALARYHLWGRLPDRLEPVAALYASAETHLVARTRSIFEGLVVAYDALAVDIDQASRSDDEDASELDVEGRLREIRTSVDEELVLAVQEVDRIRDDLAIRTSLAIGACLRDLKEDLPKIGTPDLSMRRRAASRLYKRRNEAMELLDRGTRGSRKTSAALYNRLALEMELHALEGRVKDSLEDLASNLAQDVRGRAHRQVGRVRDALADAESALEAMLLEKLTAGQTIEHVRSVCDPIMRVSAEAARASSLLRDQLLDETSVTPVLDSLTRSAHALTQRYVVPAGPIARGEHNLPPPVGTVEVPFRDWVLARIETSLAPALLESTRDVAQKVEPLSSALSDLERRVAFNVELAVNELSVLELDETVPDESRRLVGEMVGGALERNRELFESYALESSGWDEEVRSSVRRAVLSSLDELRGGLVDGEVGRMRSQMVRDVRGRRLVRVVGELRAAIGRSWHIARRAVRESLGGGRIDAVRETIGLPARLADEAPRVHTFDPPAARSAIPMVYRRLFSAQALEAGDILTGRDQALRRAMALLESGDGSLRTVAVIGPDGVGKSAFVSAVQRAKRWPRIRVLDLSTPATMEQVDALFEPHSEGHLVVVIGIRWLRAMTPAGLAPLRRFVEGVVEDAGRNAFLVQADSLVWESCRHVSALDHAFPEVVHLAPLSADELQAAVLARHTVSGYGLVFSHGTQPESRLEEWALRATSPLSRPRQSFFRALHAASGGMLRDALRLWLASVEEVDEAGDFVHLGPVPPSSIYSLRRLDADEVLTLYQIARQGWMSPEVCASLFRVDLPAARARLAALAHVGVLERRNGVFRIAVHLQGSVTRLLEERGYVR